MENMLARHLNPTDLAHHSPQAVACLSFQTVYNPKEQRWSGPRVESLRLTWKEDWEGDACFRMDRNIMKAKTQFV